MNDIGKPVMELNFSHWARTLKIGGLGASQETSYRGKKEPIPFAVDAEESARLHTNNWICPLPTIRLGMARLDSKTATNQGSKHKHCRSETGILKFRR